MITYTCDGEFHPHLEYSPSVDYAPGDSLELKDWHDNSRGWIKQVEHTYAVVGLMNEHQLAIGETTFDGRLELKNPDGLLHYWDLMQLALERAKTAREAIKVMTELVAEYGYKSTGESFSIADKEEAWIMEMIGPGEGGKGAIWVAMRIPDGYISAHANKARIGVFPLDDPDNCLYSENVISYAIENEYYDPSSGEPFRFSDAYHPPTPKSKRWADGRVWSIFRRAAPSLDISPDHFRGVEGTDPYPLWIKPDTKISVGDVFSLMRDHFEGTDYDLREGVDAGPYGSPYRWRPLDWSVDSVQYGWDRAISTQQTAFSFVSQSRSNLPDPIGGVFWYGVDDTYATCYFPLYCSITEIPYSYTVGSLQEFSWESAWWIFNFVSNFVNLKYVYMIEDLKALQVELETTALTLQPTIEQTALALHKSNPDMMSSYLTNYSVSTAETVSRRWRELGEFLIMNYNDGYVKNEEGRAENQGYSDKWLRKVLDEKADQLRLEDKPANVPETRLID